MAYATSFEQLLLVRLRTGIGLVSFSIFPFTIQQTNHKGTQSIMTSFPRHSDSDFIVQSMYHSHMLTLSQSLFTRIGAVIGMHRNGIENNSERGLHLSTVNT